MVMAPSLSCGLTGCSRRARQQFGLINKGGRGARLGNGLNDLGSNGLPAANFIAHPQQTRVQSS